MFKAEITRKDGKQFFGVSNGTEFRIDDSKLISKLKKGDIIEGKLMGGAIVADKKVSK